MTFAALSWRLTIAAVASAANWAASAAELTVVDQSGQPVSDAVVSWHPLDHPPPAGTPQTHTLGQRGLRFVPHVRVIAVGDQVNFPNQDPVRHHIYSFSAPRPLEVKLYSGLPADALDFPKAGIVVLGCNIHDWMLGFIVVLDTPWWTRSTSVGSAPAPVIPAGRYRVQVWHSQLAPQSAAWQAEIQLPLIQPLTAALTLLPAPDLDPPQLGIGRSTEPVSRFGAPKLAVLAADIDEKFWLEHR